MAKRYTNQAMHYRCEECGNTRIMFLEDGLKTHDENQKPVPFMVKCPDCGGYMHHVNFDEDLRFKEPLELAGFMDRFENLDTHPCGYPVFGSLTYKDYDIPIEIVPGKEANWMIATTINSDPYGMAIQDFAIRWALLMEKYIEQIGDAVESIQLHADELSHKANTEGITGFMYGIAVSLLARCWKHGEVLRKWNNKELGNPDAEGVLNPALLSIRIVEVSSDASDCS